MGGTLAKNSVEEVVNVSLSVINKSYQNCKTSVTGTNRVSIIDGMNINAVFDNVTVTVESQSLINCENTANFKSDVSQNINDQVAQTAEALSASLGLGQTKSEDVVTKTQTLATTINNTFQNDCNFTVFASNDFEIARSANVNLEVRDSNFRASSKLTNTCINNNEAVQRAKQDLQSTINQEAKSKSIGILALIVIIGGIIIVIIILAVLLIPLLFGTTGLVTKKKGGDEKEDSETDIKDLATSLLSS